VRHTSNSTPWASGRLSPSSASAGLGAPSRADAPSGHGGGGEPSCPSGKSHGQLDVAALGLNCERMSARLLKWKVAATPMRGWGGEVAERHMRFVFSNEPVERLRLLGDRVRAALA
jgi:aspartate/methionine/tyrosine aminotransferase